MILPKSKVIFVHIPKCAGSSIEKMLYNVPAEGIKGDFWSDECNRQTWLTVYGPNVLHNCSHQHMLLFEYEKYIPDIQDWTIFTVVRNPYERMRSAYEFACKVGRLDRRFSFEFFLRNTPFGYAPYHNYKMCDFLYNKSNLNVRILRFENLSAELVDFWKKTFNYTPDIIHDNKATVEKPILTDVCRKMIYSMYEEDFQKFGYKK